MSSMKNAVQLIGNLGKDIELKTLESGSTMAKVSIATNEYYKNNAGEKVQETHWHNLIAWGKTAELMSQVLKKGNEVLVQGKLVHNQYKDKEGNVRYSSSVKVSSFNKMNEKAAASA